MLDQIKIAEEIFTEWQNLWNTDSKKEEKIRSSGTALGAVYSALLRRHDYNGNSAYYDLDKAVKNGELDELTSLRLQIFLAEGHDPENSKTIRTGKVRVLYERLYALTNDPEIKKLLDGDFPSYIKNLSEDHARRFTPSAAEAIWRDNCGYGGIGGRDPDMMHDFAVSTHKEDGRDPVL